MCAAPAAAGTRPPPLLPLAQWWSVPLEGTVTAGPVATAARVFLAYASGSLVARDTADGHELWRQPKSVTVPLAVAGDLLFVSSGEAIEALRADNGTGVWLLPRTKTVAPIVATADWVIATTATEVIAVHAKTGEVAWRHGAGGVTLAPTLDDGRLYTGAADGRVLALQMSDGAEAWEQFFSGGVTAIAAYGGRVFVGAGDKRFYTIDGRKGEIRPSSVRLGAFAIGHIAVDEDRVYLATSDNVVRGMDRDNGNQRWLGELRQRPAFGVFWSGHVVFAPPIAGNELQMFYDRGGRAGTLSLPGETVPGLPPAIVDSPAGPIVFAITGGLTNEWNLTKFAPADDTGLVPFGALGVMPGLPFLTDPELKPLATVLRTLIIGDPPLQRFADMDWPVVLRDPPLAPLTKLPGLQLRPLSPVLPVRRGSLAPDD